MKKPDWKRGKSMDVALLFWFLAFVVIALIGFNPPPLLLFLPIAAGVFTTISWSNWKSTDAIRIHIEAMLVWFSNRRIDIVQGAIRSIQSLAWLFASIFLIIGLPAPFGANQPFDPRFWYGAVWLAVIGLLAHGLKRNLTRARNRGHLKTLWKVQGHSEKFIAYWGVLLVMIVTSALLNWGKTPGSQPIPLATAIIGLVTVNAIGLVLDAHRDCQVGMIEADDDESSISNSRHTHRMLEEVARRQRTEDSLRTNGTSVTKMLRLFR